MTSELKLCAFCGSGALRHESYAFSTHYVTCDNCGADGPAADTKSLATIAWNLRHQEQDQTSSEFERLLAK